VAARLVRREVGGDFRGRKILNSNQRERKLGLPIEEKFQGDEQLKKFVSSS